MAHRLVSTPKGGGSDHGIGGQALTAQNVLHPLRRYFCVLGALLLFLPDLAAGQVSSSAIPRLGVLSWTSCDSSYLNRSFGAFLAGLEELGHKPGETVMIECRSADGHDAGLAQAAADLVRLSVDVIVSNNQPAGRAAQQATATIPIVTVISGDPVAAGLARSLSRPGGNLTGLSYYATELTAKRLELLKEMVPAVTRIGVLANPIVSYLPFEEDTLRAATRLGITALVHHVSAPGEFERALNAMVAEGVQAVFVLPDMMLASAVPKIATLALGHRLPTMGWGSWFTKAGILMAYSTDYRALTHRLAFYVDRILKGTAPGDLPIEQPTTYQLSINLKTADALGLEVPQSLLLLADEVIE